ncbi:MAG: hypothetical protein M0Z53_14400 [Thermaerobacter sp.]|nr:hypothetical protein [Thermaerobacter sp.]
MSSGDSVMRQPSTDRRFGGICAVLVGILWVITVVVYFLGNAFLGVLVLCLALIGVLGLGVVPALMEGPESVSGVLGWARALGYLGFAVQAAQFASVLLHPTLDTALDPGEFIGYGGVAMWLLVTNWTLLGMPGRGRWRAGLGLVLAVLYAGNIVVASALVPANWVAIDAGVMVVAPIWFIWSGFAVWRKRPSAAGG